LGERNMQRPGRFVSRDREGVSGIGCLKIEVDVREAILNFAPRNALVMPGLDPGIHPSSSYVSFEERWITGSSPVMTISVGMTTPVEERSD